MSFITNNDTICAPATPTGGAIALVRISGPKTFDILSSIFKKGSAKNASYTNLSNLEANTLHHGYFCSPQQPIESPVQQSNDEIIDEVMVSVFHAPHSYTGEESAEISCHGSRFIVNSILTVLIQHGCRMASPGEFTMRAYLNGKLDLSQAEAVADLIAANDKATHHIALSQLRGHYSSELSSLREQLLKLTSLLELELDFSDHEDLEFADRDQLLSLAQEIDTHILQLAHSFEIGQAIKKGIPVAIIGKTNVGKSTLLNALLNDDRAIVSDIHGTTRDTIEDTIDIHGVTFRFIDTAGIRQTTDAIERIGIDRTYAAIEKARIILWLFDTEPSEEEIHDIVMRSKGRALLTVWNKSDLSPIARTTIAEHPVIPISAKQGTNLTSLENAIYTAANIPVLSTSNAIVTSARHYDALIQAHSSLTRVLNGLNTNIPGDLIAEDLRLTLSHLAEITGGQITPQETLNEIFKYFCVGK